MPESNEFPEAPVPAVGAIVFRGDAVLLVKRASEPNRGRWSIPGGALEIGETVEGASVRETREETGVTVRPVRVFAVSDFVETDGERVRWHYALIDVRCEYVQGEPSPATDAENAQFIPLRDLAEYDVAPEAIELLQAAATKREVASGRSLP